MDGPRDDPIASTHNRSITLASVKANEQQLLSSLKTEIENRKTALQKAREELERSRRAFNEALSDLESSKEFLQTAEKALESARATMRRSSTIPNTTAGAERSRELFIKQGEQLHKEAKEEADDAWGYHVACARDRALHQITEESLTEILAVYENYQRRISVLSAQEGPPDLSTTPVNNPSPASNRNSMTNETLEDERALITSMRMINSSIEKLASTIKHMIPTSALSRKGKNSGLKESIKLLKPPNNEFLPFYSIALDKSARVKDVVQSFLQCIISEVLIATLFGPFFPGLNGRDAVIVGNIYKSVYKNKIQATSARWRSLTYSCVSRKSARGVQFYSELSDGLLSWVAGALNTLIVPEKISSNTLKAECADTLRKMIKDAVEFQDEAKVYLSFDYEAFTAAHGALLDLREMDTPQVVEMSKNGKSIEAILPIGIGLEAYRGILKEDNTIKRERRIVLKAPVLCSTWAPGT